MAKEDITISLQAEPPLRQGQFLHNPVLHRGQAMRVFIVLAIVTGITVLSGYRPASAAPVAGQSGAILPEHDLALAPQRTNAGTRFDMAQIDLTKHLRGKAKKKVRVNPASR